MTEICDKFKIYIRLSPLDIPTWAALGLQNRASPTIQQLTFFHDFTITILTLITTLVRLNLIFIIYFKLSNRLLLQQQTIEIIWTVGPIFILLSIAAPSLSALYILDDLKNPDLTIKAIGHQWYWSYEYSDFPLIEFDSYITPTDQISKGQTRLLEADNSLILPVKTQIQVITTAADVIHAWAVPALGLKADAVPGRLNQLSMYTDRRGIFYGQCSEICGANHSFIPIKIEIIPINYFLSWIKTFESLSGW